MQNAAVIIIRMKQVTMRVIAKCKWKMRWPAGASGQSRRSSASPCGRSGTKITIDRRRLLLLLPLHAMSPAFSRLRNSCSKFNLMQANVSPSLTSCPSCGHWIESNRLPVCLSFLLPSAGSVAMFWHPVSTKLSQRRVLCQVAMQV